MMAVLSGIGRIYGPRRRERSGNAGPRRSEAGLLCARQPVLSAGASVKTRYGGGQALNVNGRATRTIWLNEDGWGVDVIDQRWLPHEFRVEILRSMQDAATAIRDMWVRGAPLIGVTAAYGVALAMRADPGD